MHHDTIVSKLWEIVFPTPRICPLCEKKQSRLMICEDCREKLAIYHKEHQHCTRCGTFGIDTAHCQNHRSWPDYLCNNKSLWPYKDEYRQVLLSFKFRGQPWLAQMLGEMLAEIADSQGEVVIPVPISRQRLQERGFNQSGLLAKEVAKELNLPYMDNVLLKVKNTPKQSSLSREERLKNLTGAFTVKHAEKIQGKKIILVDDVYTTGTTITTCAQILHEYSQSEIYAMTVCSGVERAK